MVVELYTNNANSKNSVINQFYYLFNNGFSFVPSPLAADLTGIRLLIGVCHHVASQVFLVFRSKTAAGAFMRSQICVHGHVRLRS